MDRNEIVKKYIDAWNQLDVAGLFKVFHPGAAYYDAFWMESCVGRDLTQYLRDSMDEEPYWYEQVGDAIITDSGVVFRYSAHERSDSSIGEPIFYGAEVLNLQDDMILTVTDFYCSPFRDDLEEVAILASKRHGLPTHAKSGLSALKSARIKASLLVRIEEDKDFLDSNITVSQLAERTGCTIDQLSLVINKQFGTSFGGFIDTRRIEYAKSLLQNISSDPDIIGQVATQAGFKSFSKFSEKFTHFVGVTPKDFYDQKNPRDGSDDNSYLH